MRIIGFLYVMARNDELPDEAARADIYQLDDDFEHVLPGREPRPPSPGADSVSRAIRAGPLTAAQIYLS